MKCRVVVTNSGARAILDDEVGEVMHPVVGPLVEAPRLYVSPSRLVDRLREPGPPLVLLDVGLGAGTNAITAWWASQSLPETSRRLDIVSLDRNMQALALAIEHPDDFSLGGEAQLAARGLLNDGSHETARTRWRFVAGEMPAMLDELAPASVDIVFWDMYSAADNPTLWNVAAFRALRRVCADGCTLHTYSGATAIRSALLLAGFAVGFGPAIDEKKSATTATINAPLDRPLDLRWLERVARSSAPFPSDAPADALALIRAAPQFAR